MPKPLSNNHQQMDTGDGIDDLFTQPAAGSKPAASDPFADIASLRLSQDFTSSVGVKKILMTVPVRKPSREAFIRVHPDPAYRIETAVIELKEESEVYLVAPALWPELASEATFGARGIFTAIDRQNNLFLWPIRLPGADGRLDDWNRSALEIATTIASKRWVRISANRSAGYYDCFEASADWPDPTWTDKPFPELLKLAFRERFIQSTDHPVLKRLRGEA